MLLLYTICFLSAVVPRLAEGKPPTQYIVKDPVQDDSVSLNQVSGFLSSTREKRSLWHLVRKGAEATMVLLRGAKRVPSDDNSVRVYQKQGDYNTAVMEFDRILPEDVKHMYLPDGSKGMVGHVGDRMVIVESKGYTGHPTMMIMRNVGRGDEGSDRIIYIQDGKRDPEWYNGPPYNLH